jgi:carbon monoxide dehydrogenase subunit G
MTATVVTAEIEQPAEVVFDYIIDPTKFVEWQKGVVSGRMEGSGTLALGHHCLMTRRIGFMKQTSTSELVELDRPRAWKVRGIDGPIRATVSVGVEPLAEHRSNLTIAIEFEGHGVGKLLVPLVVQRQASSEMKRDIATAKQRLDGGQF